MFTQAKETICRTHIKDTVSFLLPGENVFRTRKFFASPQDFAAQTNQTYVKGFKTTYFMIQFSHIELSKKKGCDDDPVVWVYYSCQLYRDVQEEKTTGSNSHDLMVNDAITLINGFLDQVQLDSDKIQSYYLEQVGPMIKVQPCEYVLETIGDWINFKIAFEVNI